VGKRERCQEQGMTLVFVRTANPRQQIGRPWKTRVLPSIGLENRGAPSNGSANHALLGTAVEIGSPVFARCAMTAGAEVPVRRTIAASSSIHINTACSESPFR